MACHDKECCGFHLGSEAAHAFPCLPFVHQFVADRFCLRLMLTVKSVFALYHTGMILAAFCFCSFHQCIGHGQICHCRELDRCVLFAGSFHTNRSGGNDHITALYFCLHTATRTDTDKGICTAAIQFFHCDGCGRSADTGGGHTYFYPIKSSCIRYIFSVVRYKNRIIKIFCNLCTAFRVTRQDHIASHFSFCYLNMILSACIF